MRIFPRPWTNSTGRNSRLLSSTLSWGRQPDPMESHPRCISSAQRSRMSSFTLYRSCGMKKSFLRTWLRQILACSTKIRDHETTHPDIVVSPFLIMLTRFSRTSFSAVYLVYPTPFSKQAFEKRGDHHNAPRFETHGLKTCVSGVRWSPTYESHVLGITRS